MPLQKMWMWAFRASRRGQEPDVGTDMPAGGHFAALEEPAMLADDIRAFFRPLRQ
jgi:hypothetical protein